jgi:penicillin-binding protein 2
MRRSPRDTAESSRKITRRGLILGGAQAAFAGLLAARMRYLQVDQADQFRLLAEENRINIRLIPPARGLIFDRTGVALAENEPNYRIVLVREDAGDIEAVIGRVRQLVRIEDEEVERAVKEIRRRSPFVPVTLADRLDWEEIAAVAVNAPALPGVTAEVGLSRNYPLGADFAHIVGYVGPVSDFDLQRIEDQDPLLQIPKFQIGKTGIENKMEIALRGRAGSRRIEVNAVGRVMREIDRKEGEAGTDIQLTIDHALQNYAVARLGEESAAAVVIDTTNGDLMAIASAPSFDPNKFVRGISVSDYTALTENDHRPLASKPVQGTYPPGSTFKMVVALAALEAGVLKPEETVYCPGHYESGGRRFHCWRRGGHGHVNLDQSLEQSCDVYYYDVAQRVGIEKITEMAQRLGMGQRHELPLSAVAEGLAPTKAWKQSKRGEAWLIGDTINAGIGQGFVLASPLQLALMTARIASGRQLAPRLIRSLDGIEVAAAPAPPLGLPEEMLRAVRHGMYSVSNSARGTAHATRIEAKEMRMAAKTGTSQVRIISEAERRAGVTRNEDLPWNRRDHALYVAYAPYEAPRYAVSVVVEHGGGGSTAAGPLARDILLFALYGGLPPLAAYPAAQRRKIEREQRDLPLRPAVKPADQSRTRA